MIGRAAQVAAVGLVSIAAMLFAIWAIEGHIHSGWVLVSLSVLVAPPSIMYVWFDQLPAVLFRAIFLVLEFLYVWLLFALVRRLVFARRVQ